MIAAARNRIAEFIRAKPISFAPDIPHPFFGSGIGSHQPSHETLLKENLGVADMCTRAIANRIGTLNPLVKTSTRNEEGTLDDEILDDHVLKLLLDRPHRTFSRQQLFRWTAQNIVTVGEAYWLKIHNEAHLPMFVQPMPPQHVEPIIKDGFIDAYQVRDGSGDILRLSAIDVVRFWFPDPETLYTSEGYLGPNGVNTDAYKFATEHLRSHFQNDATPAVIMKGSEDAVAPKGDQFKVWQDEWDDKYNSRRGRKSGLPAMFPPGWEPVMMAMQTGQDITPLLEHWMQQQLMSMGVPASVLGRVMSGDRSAAETNQFVFDLHTILPIAAMMSDAITLQLAPDFDESIFVEFEAFVAADKVFELTQERQDLELKVKSIKQVLEVRGDDPEKASWGDFPVGTHSDQPYTGEETTDPFDLRPDDPGAFDEGEGDDDVPVAEDQVDDEDERMSKIFDSAQRAHDEAKEDREEQDRIIARERRFRPRMERALRSVFEKQRRETIKRLNAAMPRSGRASVDVSSLFTPDEWNALFGKDAMATVTAAYKAAAIAELALNGAGESFIFSSDIAQRLRLQGAELIRGINTVTQVRMKRKIAKVLAEGIETGASTRKIAKAINEVFDGRKKNAATIARTELHRASIEAQLESFRIMNVPWIRWVDQRDNKVRDAHLSYRIAPVQRGTPFMVEGFALIGPGDRAGPPHLTVNCRCGVRPLRVDPLGINVEG